MPQQEKTPEPFNPLLKIIKMQGMIQEGKTALTIAKALISEMYGEDRVVASEPFTVTEAVDRWIIAGEDKKTGRSAMIAIAKADARVVDLDMRVPMSFYDKPGQPVFTKAEWNAWYRSWRKTDQID